MDRLRPLAFALVVSASRLASAQVPDGLQPPVLQNQVEIDYPAPLRELDEPPEGTVVVKLTVDTQGIPTELSIERSVHPELDALAMQAVAQLRYAPGQYEGQPVAITMRVPIEFVAPRPPPPPPPAPPQPPSRQTAADARHSSSPASDRAQLKGTVVRAGERTPIAEGTVLVIPAPPGRPTGRVRNKSYAAVEAPAWQRKTTTDEQGEFSIDHPAGPVRVIVVAPDFERYEAIESVDADEQLEVRYFVTPTPQTSYRTVVKQDPGRQEVVRRTITAEEINALPGTQGDALKAVQNFPGVARAPVGLGLLVIRGSDPADSRVYLGEHPIPQLFHFGGLTSVFNSDILRSIDYIPGNFDARYGDAIGGVIDVHARPGRSDGIHGYVDADLFDAGVLLEGPLGKAKHGSFAIAGRRSYIDALFPVLVPDDAGLSATVAPRYYDYQVLFDVPVGGGELSIKFFGSDDRTRLVAADPNDISPDERNRFETVLLFHRADLLYRRSLGAWDFLLTPSYRFDRNTASIGGLFRFTYDTHRVSSRAELRRQFTRWLGLEVGAQLEASIGDIEARSTPVPQSGVGSPPTTYETQGRVVNVSPAVYATASLEAGPRLTLIPSVRLSYNTSEFNRPLFEPRMRFDLAITDKTSLRGGVGLYAQRPEIFEWHPQFGNPRVGYEHALHTSLTVAHEFPFAMELNVTGFYKHLWDLATPSGELVIRPGGSIGPENFASQGLGRIYGAEVFFRKELTKSLFGWVSYTLSRSERQPMPGEAWAVFDLDQTHILTLLAVYKLPHHWQIGARFRYVTGNPYTPVVSAIYDASSGEYIPLRGPINSERVAAFHQLDVRVDKRFIWRRVSLTVYVDVQNIYNRQNQEFVGYAYDYSASQPIASLPIIPSLGLRLAF